MGSFGAIIPVTSPLHLNELCPRFRGLTFHYQQKRRHERLGKRLGVVAYYGLKEPPYNLDALEPYMSKKTLDSHWGDHHKGYLEALNGHLRRSDILYGYTMDELVKVTYNYGNPLPEFNDAAQVWNHDFFWESMQPGGGDSPKLGLLLQIEKDFGSFANFKEKFVEAAMTLFGSGWVWLVLKRKEKQLAVVKTSNAITPIVWDDIPILCLDMWEHAYYMDYKIALFYVAVLAGLLQRFPVNFSQHTAGQLRNRKSGSSGGTKVSEQGETITFADVAGVDEAKEELEEIVEFLRNPDRYIRLGARPPRGVLLVGLPGTGKTLLAKAVAGEAEVPFISCSASEFVELYVGMGASRVRDLFARAKKEAPSIIFIDEIDAVAKSRDGKFRIVSNDEREQTLNQLLTEMDGFDSNSAVIVLGATNRADVLDPALRRPGRFDRVVMVETPDRIGRESILKVHASKKELPLGDDVDLSDIACMTTGFTGADLANLVNEAALLAGRQNKSVVEKIDFIQAVERSIAGIEKKTTKLQGIEKAVVARHEVGHAVVGTAVANLLPGQPRVEKLSILPRSGGALGFTYIPPTNEDRYLLFVDELRGRLVTLLGGRAAEEFAYAGRVSTGALDDIRRATDMAYKAIAEYGLSEDIGPLSLATLSGGGIDDSGAAPWGRDQGHLVDLVQREVQVLLQSALDMALCVVRANPNVLEGLGAYLEAKEKVEGEELQEWLKKVVAPAELSMFIQGKQEAFLQLQRVPE